ncbi:MULTISPECIES: heavy-metal-associated domain-containing protein [Mycolicibacterium]|jgi:copper ion binding protein|uniref:Cation-transporting ATPase n=2 Tax=Mycolicibacterium fortuitum TaxID=1766 RepID=A0A1A2ID95_MYCFO|nr:MULTISPECIES: heavy-metal-associated domain-containing protein [Mycolicibacterium]MBP3086402.1 heavy-metal-associated domain-containing protein [Mycolicibacterium fortuitum]MCA4725906.1 heavy-metal-associated domain-containing protein [Mycolicibacterium fortuitum]MCA4752428.1 heavy-metal-associated domain-containing protein [Mycolicibacterium fortuitum]MCV7142691.1 heavy-metal-associated domain-containing protein [Mycolicibacterium fortuitum]MDG5771563.1 heavy-metal-associated domain-contai
MSTQTVTVTGMTCGHCVTSVREEVGGIPGVRSVEVDLSTGLVTIDSDNQLDPSAISDAVAEAGYAVAG